MEIWSFLRAGRKKKRIGVLFDNLGLHKKKQKDILFLIHS